MEQSNCDEEITFLEELYKSAANTNKITKPISRGVRTEKIVDSFYCLTREFKNEITQEIQFLKQEIIAYKEKLNKLNGGNFCFTSDKLIIQHNDYFSFYIPKTTEVVCLDRWDKNGNKIVNQVIIETAKKIHNNDIELTNSSKKVVLLLSRKRENSDKDHQLNF